MCSRESILIYLIYWIGWFDWYRKNVPGLGYSTTPEIHSFIDQLFQQRYQKPKYMLVLKDIIKFLSVG